jgi:hypothetical protein
MRMEVGRNCCADAGGEGGQLQLRTGREQGRDSLKRTQPPGIERGGKRSNDCAEKYKCETNAGVTRVTRVVFFRLFLPRLVAASAQRVEFVSADFIGGTRAWPRS